MSAPAPPRPPGRSLGSSLLDQVLAETVDPAYAQAAEAKRARAKAAEAAHASRVRRARAAGEPEPAAPRVRGHRRGEALVAVTMVLAGLLAALTYSEASAGAAGREAVREALIDDIETESAATDDLVTTLTDLQTEVTAARDQALAASSVGQQALARLATAETGAAAVPVTGPGLVVTLGNPLPSAAQDPVGGSGTDDPTALVLDRDLQLLVNALWAAGAEAISVDGQRLGPTTAIRQAGGAILVDFRPVSSPYEVQAIGDPDLLNNGFLRSPEATYLAGLEITYGIVFTFGRADDLTLPGASSTELREAEPVPVTEGSSDPSADPASDPTTSDDGD